MPRLSTYYRSTKEKRRSTREKRRSSWESADFAEVIDLGPRGKSADFAEVIDIQVHEGKAQILLRLSTYTSPDCAIGYI